MYVEQMWRQCAESECHWPEIASTLITSCSETYHHRPYTSILACTLALGGGLLYWSRTASDATHTTNTARLDSLERAIRAPNKPCCFKTDESSTHTITLPDGRTLGYAQFGAPGGRPLFNLHGFPGSRIEAAALEPIALQLNLRVIGVDRPGCGKSSPHPNRALLDHPRDLVHLAEHLGLSEYAVLGTSGGGPYAIACAYGLPADKLKAVAVVCGMGAPDMSKKGMNWLHWAGFSYGWLYFPALCAWWMSREPHARLDLSREERTARIAKSLSAAGSHEKDLEIFNSHFGVDIVRLIIPNHEAAFSQGVRLACQDAVVMCEDWGFKLEDIRKDLPIHLWYGKLDVNCPPGHGEETAARIGGKSVLHLEDETHGSITFNCTWGGPCGDRAIVLQELAKSMG